MNRITPGQLVNSLFRRVDLRRELLIAESTIWRWAQPYPRGTGGLIPSKYHADLLALSGRQGVDLTAEDLVLGRTTAPGAGTIRQTTAG